MNSLVQFVMMISLNALAIQVVSESPHANCTSFEFPREIKVYKDPSFFIPDENLMYTDPQVAWDDLMEKSPVLTTLRGSVHLMLLGSPSEFKGFGEVTKLYELTDGRLKSRKKQEKKESIQSVKVIPVKICGQNEAYADSLGFVVESDLAVAQSEELIDGRLPPSTSGRPIPKIPNKN